MKFYEFRNGDKVPAIGLGTWKMTDGSAYNAVKTALKVGYRHFDCAHIYGNELDVGAGLADAIELDEVSRDDLFVTSKLWNDCHDPEDVIPALETTLRNLQLEHVDLYLMHWPIAHEKGVDLPESADQFISLEKLPLEATWKAMENCVDQGFCKHIGVANFNQPKLERILSNCERAPEMNQVESHAFLQQSSLLDFCQSKNILMTAYSPLGSADRPERLRKDNEPSLLEHDQIASIANKHGATPAQVLLAWGVQRDTIVIPKSTDPGRMKENLDAAKLNLDEEDMGAIQALDRDFRFIDGQFWENIGGPYTVDDLWNH